jgi:alpha-L-rhamnosidase/Domain of Unknown Function (DUF1080)
MKQIIHLTLILFPILGTIYAAEPVKPAKAPDKPWTEPPVVEPKYDGTPVAAPEGATILFNAKGTELWMKVPGKADAGKTNAVSWKLENDYMEVVPSSGMIQTTKPFITSGHLHIEWATPAEVKGTGQGRGNSGVFIEGLPEIQVLDSFNNKTYFDGQAAAFYKRRPPLVNACRGPGLWQCYDIHIKRATVEKGKVVKPATATVYHNNVLVQDGFEFSNPTQAGILKLQDHSNPVRFRNIWFLPTPTGAQTIESLRAGFETPPKGTGTTTLWWLKGKLTKEEIRAQLLNLRDKDGFGGVAPLPMLSKGVPTDPAYLTNEYFDMYGYILDTAKELGMTVVFYDDNDFPSGRAGTLMAEKYPDDLLKYLARGTNTVIGPAEAVIKVPEGRLMSVVAKNLETGERRVVTSEAHLMSAAEVSSVRWSAPAGRWEVQAFVCATAPRKFLVDYLDPQAVKKFMGLTYDRFYERFPAHFGTTIRMTFYDDLSVYQAPDDLIWTPSFNETFQKRFGRSPEALYPALWEDMGPETAAARASLYGMRNELFAAGYPQEVEKWCAKRGMHGAGHPAGAYDPNPLQLCGDGILFYKYQSVPLTDYIHYYGHGVDGIKIPASAANNFDRDTVVCEIYGNFHQKLPNDSNMLYRAAMEMYVRGINYLLPHGTWWDPEKVRIPPEISWRNPAIGPELATYNQWTARCESLLRTGRHVADIAVLYPIDDLEARTCVGPQSGKHGKVPIPGTDYYEISRLLTGEVKRDFTFLHPETVNERCRVEGNEFVLNNTNHWERYKVVILPACRTIRLANLTKLCDFLRNGGRVIATTCLPEQSAEFGCDTEVQKLAKEMFGPQGKGIFLPQADESTLRKALDSLAITWDVRLDNATDIPRVGRKGEEYIEGKEHCLGNRAFAYIHRSVPGAEVYFFCNSSDLEVKADVSLRGTKKLEIWNPHTGTIEPLASKTTDEHGQPVSTFALKLAPLRSLFVVGR